LNELAQALPALTRLADVRKELAEAEAREKHAASVRQEVETRGKKLKAEVDQLTSEVAAAAQARQQADEQATRARTLQDQARGHIKDLVQVSGAKICRHCGQELTPGHVEAEKIRRERELNQAKQELQDALHEQQNAHDHQKQIEARQTTQEQHRQQAREDYR